MKRIDRDKMGEELSAYLDGELDDECRAAVEKLLERDPAARAELERLRQTAAMLGGLPRQAAPPALLDLVMARTGRDEARLDSATQRHAFRRVRLSMLLGMAAVVAAGVGVGLWGLTQRGLDRSSYHVASAPRSAELEAQNLRGAGRLFASRLEAPGDNGPAAESQPLPDGRGSVGNEEPLPDGRGSVGNEEPLSDSRGAVWDERTAAPLTELTTITADKLGAHEKSDKKAPTALNIQVTYRDEAEFERAVRSLNQFGARQADDAGAPMNAYGVIRAVDHVVRVPRSQLARLIASLATGACERREFTMSVDEIEEAGDWTQAERLLARSAPPTDRDSIAEGVDSTRHRMMKGREGIEALDVQAANIPQGRGDAERAKMSAGEPTMQKAQAPRPARSAGAAGSESSAVMGGQVAASFESEPIVAADDDFISVHVRLMVPITPPPSNELGKSTPPDAEDP